MSWTVGNVTLARMANTEPQNYTIVLTLVHLDDNAQEEGLLFYPSGGYAFDCWTRVDQDTLPTEYVTNDYKHCVKAKHLHVNHDILSQIEKLFPSMSA